MGAFLAHQRCDAASHHHRTRHPRSRHPGAADRPLFRRHHRLDSVRRIDLQHPRFRPHSTQRRHRPRPTRASGSGTHRSRYWYCLRRRCCTAALRDPSPTARRRLRQQPRARQTQRSRTFYPHNDAASVTARRPTHRSAHCAHRPPTRAQRSPLARHRPTRPRPTSPPGTRGDLHHRHSHSSNLRVRHRRPRAWSDRQMGGTSRRHPQRPTCRAHWTGVGWRIRWFLVDRSRRRRTSRMDPPCRTCSIRRGRSTQHRVLPVGSFERGGTGPPRSRTPTAHCGACGGASCGQQDRTQCACSRRPRLFGLGCTP